MAETKDDIAAERDELRAEADRLRAENENLRGQLAAAGAGQRAPQARHLFVLSEGSREELARTGMTIVDGRMRTRDEVERMLSPEQQGVDIVGDGAEPDQRTLEAHRRREGDGIYGVDYVWPSVEPGRLDPAVAGTPGINGPAAE